ncbi:MAG: hypothetical protein ACE5Z5_03625 [Candidatus Bathyarchaeia archaeon]
MASGEKEEKRRIEASGEIPEEGFFCIHCGCINPKGATYCIRCGKMPYYDPEV